MWIGNHQFAIRGNPSEIIHLITFEWGQTKEVFVEPRTADTGLFRRILLGLSCRNYRSWAEAIPKAFGLSTSTVSCQFIRASARRLCTLCERRFDQEDFVALVLKGKTFAHETMVIALVVR